MYLEQSLRHARRKISEMTIYQFLSIKMCAKADDDSDNSKLSWNNRILKISEEGVNLDYGKKRRVARNENVA